MPQTNTCFFTNTPIVDGQDIVVLLLRENWFVHNERLLHEYSFNSLPVFGVYDSNNGFIAGKLSLIDSRLTTYQPFDRESQVAMSGLFSRQLYDEAQYRWPTFHPDEEFKGSIHVIYCHREIYEMVVSYYQTLESVSRITECNISDSIEDILGSISPNTQQMAMNIDQAIKWKSMGTRHLSNNFDYELLDVYIHGVIHYAMLSDDEKPSFIESFTKHMKDMMSFEHGCRVLGHSIQPPNNTPTAPENINKHI